MRRTTRPVVLVVDDGKHHVTLLRLALMQRGFAVIVVSSIEGAHTMLRECAVDAMLVAMTEVAAGEALHAIGEARPRVTLALAGEGTGEALAGFDIVLQRPIDFGELDIALRTRLQRRTSGTRTRVAKRGVA